MDNGRYNQTKILLLSVLIILMGTLVVMEYTTIPTPEEEVQFIEMPDGRLLNINEISMIYISEERGSDYGKYVIRTNFGWTFTMTADEYLQYVEPYL